MPQPLSYAEFREEVEAIYALKAKATLCKVRQVLREFGELPSVRTTADLRPVAVARWRAAHPDRSDATCHSLLRSFRSACELGIASGCLAANPCAPKQLWPDVCRPERERHLPLHEISALLEHLERKAGLSWHGHRLYALVATVAYTGLRKLEALRLQVTDLDFARGCVRVVARKRLKTRAAEAPVGMPAELEDVLRGWLTQIGRSLVWLFPNVSRTGPWTGGPPGHKPLDRLQAEAREAGLDGCTFQSLRHSWATHAELWGLGETMIQRQLRHTTRRTQEVYRHADVANLAGSVRSISFRPQASATPRVAAR
jgi:integrase